MEIHINDEINEINNDVIKVKSFKDAFNLISNYCRDINIKLNELYICDEDLTNHNFKDANDLLKSYIRNKKIFKNDSENMLFIYLKNESSFDFVITIFIE